MTEKITTNIAEKRKDFTSLPAKGEINDILGKEAKRELPKGRENLHFFNFSTVKNLLNNFGLDGSYFDSELDDFDSIDGAVESSKKIIQDLESKISSLVEFSEEDIKIFDEMYDYLSEEDVPEKSDFIFVFGAKTPLRIEKAIELYKEGLSDKIIVSGRGPNYEDVGVSEAEKYKKIAVEDGIPEEKIITEEMSITIPDNVRTTLNMLDKNNIKAFSFILVNSPYVQRRGWAHFKKYLPDGVKLYRVNCGTGENYQKDSWYKNPSGVKVIVGEFFKAKIATLINTA